MTRFGGGPELLTYLRAHSITLATADQSRLPNGGNSSKRSSGSSGVNRSNWSSSLRGDFQGHNTNLLLIRRMRIDDPAGRSNLGKSDGRHFLSRRSSLTANSGFS